MISQCLGQLEPFELPPTSLPGDLVLGTDLRDRPIRVPSQYLNAHSLTVGGSGSGKTTKSKFLIPQVAPKVEGMWLFDFDKEEFAPLKPCLAQLGVTLRRVPARQICLNPLQCPEHVSQSDWAPRSADLLVQTLQLPARATKLLHLTILKLYREFDNPTLFDLREAIACDPDANHQAKHAVVDSLDPVLMSIGDVLRYRVGWKTGALAKHHIVFELGGTSEVDKNLILNSLVIPEFVSRVAQGISNPVMDLWICCDEAARLVSSGAHVRGVADLIGRIRGSGMGIDLSTQSADIASEVLSNTACKFLGRCGSATDYKTMGAAMGLTAEQRHWLSMNLRPGMFVGQLGEGEWRRPFVFKIPLLQL